MTNVIHLTPPVRMQPVEARIGALLQSFAADRRSGDDVFWLKENAEILNILECTGASLDDSALLAHQDFYDTVEKRLGFFPQYYRFLLSITLDLEALGMPGDKGAKLVDWVCDQGLAQGELSDLQRMEARRIMARRGRDPLGHDTGLDQRMHDFINRSQTFALPNKKAAYELTHTVFYLSEYGRRDPGLDPRAITSLQFTGLLAFIDQNADLLAEVCVAMRYAGASPASTWTDWLADQTRAFGVTVGWDVSVQDDYHEYLVCNWHQSVAGDAMFTQRIEGGRMRFDRSAAHVTPLREVSEWMLDMHEDRSGDWHQMRARMEPTLSPEAMAVLASAARSCDQFEAFFAGFARADIRGISA